MDATDKLRRMLDELGIEWWHDDDISPDHTEWMTDDAVYTSLGMDGDMLSVKAISKMTPEQAIAATVGAGTCHMEVKDNLAETEGMGEAWLECDRCHWQMPLEPTTPRFKYCPHCRARIKKDEGRSDGLG